MKNAKGVFAGAVAAVVGATTVLAEEDGNDIASAGNGGVIKTGPGAMKFNNAANSFTGTLEIRQGSVRFNSADALTAKPAVTITGGELDVSTMQQTIGALQLNSGTISSSSAGGVVFG